jgi:hypothetical protein
MGVRDVLFGGAPKSKKRRRIDDSVANRPCSPSLFPSSANSNSTTQSSDQLNKRRDLGDQLEVTLGEAVSPLYNRPLYIPQDDDAKLVAASRYSSLGYLLLPIRRTSPLEKWTPHDIGVFESALCTHGKKFDMIQSLLPHKTVKDVVDFYYIWKNTSHKSIWKKTFKEAYDEVS